MAINAAVARRLYSSSFTANERPTVNRTFRTDRSETKLPPVDVSQATVRYFFMRKRWRGLRTRRVPRRVFRAGVATSHRPHRSAGQIEFFQRTDRQRQCRLARCARDCSASDRYTNANACIASR
jgi:hypothetical protein